MDGNLWQHLSAIGYVNKTLHIDGTANSTQENITSTISKNDGTITENLLPEWVIYLYLSVFIIGASFNLLQGLVLLFSRKNGLTSIILQITIADTLLVFVAVLEIISSNQLSWTYSVTTCMIFKGLEIFVNTLIPYLIVCLNFHVTSLWNLHKYENKRNLNKNPLTSCDNDSNECLVTKNEKASRNVTIDYRKRKNDVAVIFPILLVWFICLSLSIPNFVFSSTKITQGKTLCVIIENNYGKILYSLILVFSLILPYILLVISLAIVIFKLINTSQKAIDEILTKKFDEIRRLLIFCIVFSVLYFVTATTRHILSSKITVEEVFILGNYNFNNSNIYQNMVHYSASSLRYILYFFMIPNFRKQIVRKLCFCRKAK